MTTMFGALAFLIAIDLAICGALFLNYRATRESFLLAGLAMIGLEGARQIINTFIVALPDRDLLFLLSTIVFFGTTACLPITAIKMRDRRIGWRWVVFTLAAESLIVGLNISLGADQGFYWFSTSVPIVFLLAGTVFVLARDRRPGHSGDSWLMGLVCLLMLMRILQPFSVVGFPALFGLVYFADSVVVAFIGGTLSVTSIERLARGFQAAKERVEQSGELVRTALDVTYDAIVTTDARGHVVTWNRSAASTLGWTPEEALGRPVSEIVPNIDEAHPGVASRPVRVKTCTRSGRPIELDMVKFRAELRGDEIFVRILRDVTEQLRSEAEIRALEDQVQHVQRLESLGVFAGGVAHDFNNILAAIMSFADLGLNETAAGTRQEHCLREILGAAERGSDLTRQILAYAGRSATLLATIDAVREIEGILRLLKTVVSKKTRVVPEYGAQVVPVHADRSQFGQIILNLVSNASDSLNGEVGTIRICADTVRADRSMLSGYLFGADLTAGEYVRLRIGDTGCGMSQDQAARIFDPFYTTKLAGRGLGMTTVLAIVRTHGGAIRVESGPGAGTTVTVLLPPGATRRASKARRQVPAGNSAHHRI